jgi:hypothetical protein
MRCSHSNCRMLARAQLKSQNCLSKPSQSARRLRSAAFQLPNKNKNGSRRIPSTPVAQTSTSCNAAVTLPFWSGSRSRGRTTRTSQPSERLLNSWGKYLRGDPIGDKAAANTARFVFPGTREFGEIAARFRETLPQATTWSELIEFIQNHDGPLYESFLLQVETLNL